MKNYFVELYMDSGEKITAIIDAEDKNELIKIITMEDEKYEKPVSLNCRFNHLDDICYCVGHVSSIHYKEM